MVAIAAPRPPRPRAAVAGLVVGAAGAYACATAAGVAATTVPTTYPAVSTVSTVADLAAGFGLIAVGGWWTARRPGANGPLASGLGVAWLTADWSGWLAAPPLVRSIAAVVQPFLPALLLHMVLAYPTGALTGRTRRIVGTSYAVTVVLTAGRAVTYDPFRDLSCWSNCTDNVFLVRAVPALAHASGIASATVAAGTGALLVAYASVRLLASRPAQRRSSGPVLLPGAAVAASCAVQAVVQLTGPPRDPLAPGLQRLFQAQAGALAALALGLGWVALREERTRRALARLAGDLAADLVANRGLAAGHGRLREVLAHALEDPTVEVGYWVPEGRRYVDPDGLPFFARHGGVRATTVITRGGQPLACVIHDPALGRGRDLASTIGAAAGVAVDNERLMAEARAYLAELRASCARIVAAGDGARARWERDLHDGAQQRLFALAHELRVARAAADAGDPRSVEALDQAVRAAGAAAAALRELAQGIYPPLLADAGLGPALEALSDDAPLPVVLDQDVRERPTKPVERALYLLVGETIGIAARAEAGRVDVRVRQVDRVLTLTAWPLTAAPGEEVVDHITALEGRLWLQDRTLTAEVPCG